MNNIVRKELRRIVSELIQLRDFLKDDSQSDCYEYDWLSYAITLLVKADSNDFHIGRKKCYNPPKKSFVYEKK